MGALLDLIVQWEAFLQTNAKADVQGFAEWLLQNKQEKNTKRTASGTEFSASDLKIEQGEDKSELLQKQSMFLLAKMYQYLQFYTKPIIRRHRLHSLNDFSYLATVFWYKSITKSKVIALNMGETTTGFDIIKRLVKMKLIKEQINKTDKREKIVEITAKGLTLFATLQHDFKQLPRVLADLNAQEQQSIVTLLNRMDQYHNEIVKQQKDIKKAI